MANIKLFGYTKIQGKALCSTSESGGGGGPTPPQPTPTPTPTPTPPATGPVDTTIYNSLGNVLFTVNGDVPSGWATNVAGYVVIGSSANIIGDYAFQYSKLTSATIPNSVTRIGKQAFENTDTLQSVTIGNFVTSIGYAAFVNTQLTSVTIPNSVTSIEGIAFYRIPSLSVVNCYAPLTAFVGTYIFFGTASPLTIHVRATDATWTAGTGLSFQGNNNVTIIKDL